MPKARAKKSSPISTDKSESVQVVLLMPPIQRSILNPKYDPALGKNQNEPKTLTTQYTEKGQVFTAPKAEAEIWIAQGICRLASDIVGKPKPDAPTGAIPVSSRLVSPEELAAIETGSNPPIAAAIVPAKVVTQPEQIRVTQVDTAALDDDPDADDLDDDLDDSDMDTVDDPASHVDPGTAKLAINQVPATDTGIELINTMPISGLGLGRSRQILERRPDSGYESVTHLMALNPELGTGAHRVASEDLAEYFRFDK